MQKFVFIILVLPIGSGALLSQNFNISITPDQEKLVKKADSLEQQLDHTPDSLKWERLYELSQTYQRFPRKDTIAIQQGKAISRKQKVWPLAKLIPPVGFKVLIRLSFSINARKKEKRRSKNWKNRESACLFIRDIRFQRIIISGREIKKLV